MASEEQVGLLQNIYDGEREPETKEQENVVEGVPAFQPGNVIGSAVPSSPWSTGLFSCFGNNDEFCSSDLEVCILGTFAPCVLFASNVERLNPTESTFSSHCLSYTGLLFLGKLLFGCNALAPCFSYPSRTDIRRKFNLQGTGECFGRSCLCCNGSIGSEEDKERCESLCDFATHILCHRCALCQEGREVRRRVVHPGFFRPFMAMVPPVEQSMIARQ